MANEPRDIDEGFYISNGSGGPGNSPFTDYTAGEGIGFTFSGDDTLINLDLSKLKPRSTGDTGDWVPIYNGASGEQSRFSWTDFLGIVGSKVTDAPSDGQTYVRKDGAWIVGTVGAGGGITDAPSDGSLYGRLNGAWTAVAGSSHTHVVSDIIGLSAAISGKMDTTSNLLTLSALNVSANTIVYGSGTGAFSMAPLSPYSRGLLGGTDGAAWRAALGAQPSGSYQTQHVNLTRLSDLSLVADQLPYASATNVMALTSFTSFGRTLVGSGNAAAGRTALGAVGEAPTDGNSYIRKDGGWVLSSQAGGAITDAPSNGTAYGRKNAAWVAVTEVGHTHTTANITGLDTALAGKQPLNALLTGLAAMQPITVGRMFYSDATNSFQSFAIQGFGLTWLNYADAATARTALGAIADAPSNGNIYSRQNGAWVLAPTSGSGLTDAPSDGVAYGRKNATWVAVSETSHTHAYSSLTSIPTTFAPSAHTHLIADLPVATSGTSNTTQVVRADDSRLSNARTPTTHTHVIADTTGLQTALDGKQPLTTILTSISSLTTLNAGYGIYSSATNTFSASEVTTFGRSLWAAVDASAARTLTGAIGDAPNNGDMYVRQLNAWVIAPTAGGGTLTDAPNNANAYGRKAAGWVAVSEAAHTHAYNSLTGVPTTFAPSAHTHLIADLPVAASGVSNTTSVVRADDSRLSNARTPTAHTHVIADTTGLQTALDGKQPLDAALTNLAALPIVANKMLYTDGVDSFQMTDIQAYGLSLINQPSAAAALTTLGAIADAPNNGNIYARQSGAWVLAPTGGGTGGITDAPSNGTTYGRLNATWVAVAPATHTHTTAQVTGLDAALTGKQSTTPILTSIVNAPWVAGRMMYADTASTVTLVSIQSQGLNLLNTATPAAAQTLLQVPGEAPSTGSIYGRQNGAWVVVTGGTGGGIAEAPSDSITYGRRNAAWAAVAPLNPDVQTISANRTLAAADSGKMFNVTAAITITIPTAVGFAGFNAHFKQTAATGQVTFVVGAGMNPLSNVDAHTRTQGPKAIVSLFCFSALTVDLAGRTAA